MAKIGIEIKKRMLGAFNRKPNNLTLKNNPLLLKRKYNFGAIPDDREELIFETVDS